MMCSYTNNTIFKTCTSVQYPNVSKNIETISFLVTLHNNIMILNIKIYSIVKTVLAVEINSLISKIQMSSLYHITNKVGNTKGPSPGTIRLGNINSLEYG